MTPVEQFLAGVGFVVGPVGMLVMGMWVWDRHLDKKNWYPGRDSFRQAERRLKR